MELNRTTTKAFLWLKLLTFKFLSKVFHYHFLRTQHFFRVFHVAQARKNTIR